MDNVQLFLNRTKRDIFDYFIRNEKTFEILLISDIDKYVVQYSLGEYCPAFQKFNTWACQLTMFLRG